jgi:hypothetical protein
MRPVFISYATSDRKEALALCEAIERRGLACWIACRDVQPGENYQEAIVRAIRTARAMVLVFSDRANNSDEIKKEMSLVSRFRVPMLALRIEDVEPGDAFAYELATRQWIDLFEDWDKSLDALVARVTALKAADDAEEADPTPAPAPRPATVRAAPPPPPPAPRRGFGAGSLIAVAAAVLVLVAIAGASWFFLRGSQPRAEHSMEVRWTGFQLLSPDLPKTLPDAMRDETIAAFSDDGVVGVSTAAAPPPGDMPAYALGGTIRRDGDKIRVIARLTNERSGTTLWSNDFSYDPAQQARLPRMIAIDAGNLVRCGLFAASTYPRPLPDPVLTAYLQYCHNGIIVDQPAKALDAARKVAAAAPDFSWGWSAVQDAILAIRYDNGGTIDPQLLAEAQQASAKAVALDPSNSEALSNDSFFLPRGDLLGREALLQKSLKARPLACGCEHHYYGGLLEEVGRTDDAIAEYRRGIDVLALNPGPQWSLAVALAEKGDADESAKHAALFADLIGMPGAQDAVKAFTAASTRDYAGAARILAALPAAFITPRERDIYMPALQALASGNAQAKAAAITGLQAAKATPNSARFTISLLAALGANAQALQYAVANPEMGGTRQALMIPALTALRADPGFPAAADALGLTRYWKTTGIKPDFCKASGAPAFCRTL